MLFAAPNNLLF